MGNNATVGVEQQHLRALEYANRVRLARARMKRKIAAGELSAADVDHELSLAGAQHVDQRSADEPEAMGTNPLQRLLVSLGVPENKQIGTLTERQRLALAAVLTAKRAPVTSTADEMPAATPAMPPAAAPIGREQALSAA